MPAYEPAARGSIWRVLGARANRVAIAQRSLISPAFRQSDLTLSLPRPGVRHRHIAAPACSARSASAHVRANAFHDAVTESSVLPSMHMRPGILHSSSGAGMKPRLELCRFQARMLLDLARPLQIVPTTAYAPIVTLSTKRCRFAGIKSRVSKRSSCREIVATLLELSNRLGQDSAAKFSPSCTYKGGIRDLSTLSRSIVQMAHASNLSHQTSRHAAHHRHRGDWACARRHSAFIETPATNGCFSTIR